MLHANNIMCVCACVWVKPLIPLLSLLNLRIFPLLCNLFHPLLSHGCSQPCLLLEERGTYWGTWTSHLFTITQGSDWWGECLLKGRGSSSLNPIGCDLQKGHGKYGLKLGDKLVMVESTLQRAQWRPETATTMEFLWNDQTGRLLPSSALCLLCLMHSLTCIMRCTSYTK